VRRSDAEVPAPQRFESAWILWWDVVIQASHKPSRRSSWRLPSRPTTKPRYTITDSGSVSELLDEAQRRWPDHGLGFT